MNKRFLLNVVKATDSHNQALIKATEEQAEENRRRMERERRYNDYRDRSPQDRPKRRHRNSRSPSPSSSSYTRKHQRRHSPATHSKQTGHHSSASDMHSDASESVSSQPSMEKPSSTIFKGRGNITAGGPSAMDKYFKESYDPKKDTGDAVDDKGWVLGGEEKTEKKASKKKKSKKKNKSREHDDDSKRHKSKKHKKHKHERIVTIEPSAKVGNLSDGIVYNKGVREWDMGKK